MASVAKTNPKKKLRVTPRKMEEGEKLNRRNPSNAPASVMDRMQTKWLPWISETTKTERVTKKAIPVAKPSSPSIRLNELVIATIQNTVRSKLKKRLWML